MFDYRVGYWAAAARIGQVSADFVDQLYMVEIPKNLEVQDEWGNRKREIFCDRVVEKAAPFESKAVFGFDLCLKAADKESSFGEWSTLCEVELNHGVGAARVRRGRDDWTHHEIIVRRSPRLGAESSLTAVFHRCYTSPRGDNNANGQEADQHHSR